MKRSLFKTLNGLAAAALLVTSPFVHADGNTATYTGQGLNSNPDGFGGYDLNLEICGIANGAESDDPYLLWVFTATGSTSATISGPFGQQVAMTKVSGGTFKYVSSWFDPNTLLPNVVTATAPDGKTKNAQLTVSHGCRPYKKGDWCSPGFWKNADAGAWALTGRSKTDAFNSTVYEAFYGALLAQVPASSTDPTLVDATLWTVLSSKAGTYKGAGVAGTNPDYPVMNAFNATGAFLSNNIPGYQFDPALYQGNDSVTCPIDHFGNFKPVTTAPVAP